MEFEDLEEKLYYEDDLHTKKNVKTAEKAYQNILIPFAEINEVSDDSPSQKAGNLN
jgi:hypothetical protein